MSLVGKALPRREDGRFLSGAACFVDDFRVYGMAHAVVVRSPVAHGVLRGIDTADALAAPGVLAVLTFADIADRAGAIPLRLAPLPGFERFLQRPLASDRVRYVGEPIALVVAEDRYRAEDAAELVVADIEPLPAVPDVASARADSSVLFETVGTNFASRYAVSRGDPDRAFARAEHVRRERLRVHRHTALPLETRGLVAKWDPGAGGGAGRLTLWGATKCTFFNRRVLAGLLGLPESAVELVELDVGGSFGVRGEFYPEDLLVPLAAMRLGRPVKWIEDRAESFVATNHSREMECELEVAALRDGTILGMRARLTADLGAYARTSGGVMVSKAALFLPGPYRIPDYACEVEAVVTSKTPVGTYRGPGRYEATFFRERVLDLLAADLGIDPVELRRRNLLTCEELPFEAGALVPYENASVYDSGDYPAALERLVAEIDYRSIAASTGRREDGWLHGVGIACFVESSGAGPPEAARVRVAAPGRIELYTGCASSGQGHETVLAQIAADELGVPLDALQVFHGTTSYVEGGGGTFHGRGVVMGGSAVQAAARNLVAQVVDLAARRSGMASGDLVWASGAVHRRDAPGGPALLTLDALAAEAAAGSDEARDALEASGRFATDRRTFSYGAQGVRLRVDPETGAVEVLRVLTVEDVGRAINPMIVHGQAVGAAVQGLGGALLEELEYDEGGQLLTGTFADYMMPTAHEFPRVEAITTEDAPSPLNPLGAKGAGEGGIVPTAAAVANAVANALGAAGAKAVDLPLTPPKIVRLLRPG